MVNEQTSPLLFTHDGHTAALGGIYRGQSAFLACSGPSLVTHDLSLLQHRGIVTLAVNNAATIIRPQLWVSVDDPGNFCDAIWRDPGIWKFIPQCHLEKQFTVRRSDGRLVPSSERVGEMPCVFGYRRNDTFVAETFLYESTFNWGNHAEQIDAYGQKGSRSVMYVALRLLFHLGFRRVFLLGCDFRMERDKQNYAFEQDRSPSSVRGNNSSYKALNVRLKHLKPYFDGEGFEVLNCTPNSGLTAFPYLDYEEAIRQATAPMPKAIVTAGMYDRQARERQAADAAKPRKPQVAAMAPAAVPRPKPQARPVPTTEEVLRGLTVVAAVDRARLPALEASWQTWLKLRPEFRQLPKLIVFDATDGLTSGDLATFRETPATRLLSRRSPRPRTSSGDDVRLFLDVAASEVKTPWFLKLDPEVIAVRDDPWLDRQWFAQDDQGRLPAFIGSAQPHWSSARELNALDDWGDSVESLKTFSRLLPADSATTATVPFMGVATWCFFGNTDWTRHIAELAADRPSVSSDDLYLHYFATRHRDYFVRARMTDWGWQRISNPRALRRRVAETLGEPLIAGAGVN